MASSATRRLCVSGMLIALSIVSVMIVRLPIFPAVSFLEYDPADIFIFLGTFLYGPTVGILLTVATALLQGFTVSASSGVYGVIMHILSTGSYVIVAGITYSRQRTLNGAIISMVLGTAISLIVMFLANLIVTPIFMGVSVEVVWSLMIWILLFNIVKPLINSIITFALYKGVGRLIGLVFMEGVKLGTLVTNSHKETYNRAREMGARLKGGDIVLLEGDLGAGKTVFTKGIARALGVREAVTSPTFNIVKEYDGKIPLYHFDMYRLDEDEADSIGLEEYFDKGGICVIEWNKTSIPRANVYKVSIQKLSKNSRQITITKEKSL